MQVDVEYEWLPPKCKQCVSLGHSTATCPESNKNRETEGAVYVTERPVQPPPTVSKPMAKDAVRTVQHTVPEEDGTVDMEIGTDERSYIDKGKRRDHQVAVKELVKRIQVKLSCRRGLWQSLVTLADSISDEPWIVGGDFNTVVDMSEVCGASADIHLAMNEFRDLKEIVAYGNVWIDCWLMMLGYDCGRIRIINVLTLGLPITPHLCSEEILKHTEESQALVQSVTREEIKDAFFDIAEDKAPGPDGYSSVSIKQLGRLLRLRLVLDKLISPSQNAFVPGRSIGDNILLAQELFAGYNRQGLPMRCALKVDLRKAYDTVEWDFLSAVLQCLDFRAPLLDGLRSVSLLLCSRLHQWEPSRFLQGFQGLRQGDPMSPFLFVLIMEVLQLMLLQLIDQNEGFSFHWRCKELGLFQLCFADDLLLFCKADVASVRFLDTGWTSSPNCPGYMPIHKRVSLFSPVQHRMSGTTTCSTTFPGGSPSPQLSFAGRLQLIKSVLMSLNVYWAMAFILPKGVIREVEKKMRTFLWKGNSAVGYPKVAWSVVCKPIEEGGQGIRDILALNKALMSRHLWNVIQNNQSSIWVKWIAHTRLRHKSVWTVDVKGGSWGWRKILRLRSALLPYIEFKIGDGNRSLFGMTRGIASAP
ncbi:putative ribonuclease H protein [Sesamum angolense]|uniref:Ribonuclease H protein n=1 Tax=Sesamum angolense TaxID=2727404 RepID=A0AAE1W0J0_9LAMI|nr:putative ribonuclease H protein [Sesamum angolense]